MPIPSELAKSSLRGVGRQTGEEPESGRGHGLIVTENPDGPGPFVFVCDHASNRIPDAYMSFGFAEDALSDPHRLGSRGARRRPAPRGAIRRTAVLAGRVPPHHRLQSRAGGEKPDRQRERRAPRAGEFRTYRGGAREAARPNPRPLPCRNRCTASGAAWPGGADRARRDPFLHPDLSRKGPSRGRLESYSATIAAWPIFLSADCGPIRRSPLASTRHIRRAIRSIIRSSAMPMRGACRRP